MTGLSFLLNSILWLNCLRVRLIGQVLMNSKSEVEEGDKGASGK